MAKTVRVRPEMMVRAPGKSILMLLGDVFSDREYGIEKVEVISVIAVRIPPIQK